MINKLNKIFSGITVIIAFWGLFWLLNGLDKFYNGNYQPNLTNTKGVLIAPESDNEISNVDVWLGQKNSVAVYTKEDIYKTIKKARKNRLKLSVNYNGPVEAPIQKDQIIAKLKLVYEDEIIGEYNLHAKEDIKRLNIFSRLIRSLNYLIWGDV